MQEKKKTNKEVLKLTEIKQLLKIDLTSPSGLRWMTDRSSKAKLGDAAGGLTGGIKNGICYALGINGKYYKNHRIIYALYHNLELDQLPKQLDHIDRNKLNNDPLNLRSATTAQNAMNRGTNSRNTSGAKGVWWYKSSCKWISCIRFNGVYKYLGSFEDVEDAKRAYDNASTSLHGEFSYISNGSEII